MADDQHSDPSTEGAARAAQIAAMTSGVVEALARLRTQLAAERTQNDEQAAAAARAERLADHAAARVRWTPALEEGWLRGADTADVARAWGAARPWSDTDPDAAQVTYRCEARLRALHPEAMRRFDELRQRGGAEEAMRQAAPLFAAAPSAPGATAPGQITRPDADAAKPEAWSPKQLAAQSYPYVITTVPASSRGDQRPPGPGRGYQHDAHLHAHPQQQRPLQPR